MFSQKRQILFKVVLFAIVAYSTILISPLLYCDDAFRVYTQMSINQNVNGRPFADILYTIFANGSFVNISPLTQIISITFFTLSGMLLTDTFLKKMGKDLGEWQQVCVALFLVIFPINSSILSYRYDSLSMGFAVLCATLAFTLTASSPSLARFPRLAGIFLPAVFLTLVIGLYQPMTGVFFCCTAFFIAASILNNDSAASIVHDFLAFLRTTILGGILFIPFYLQTRVQQQQDFMGLGPHPYVSQSNKISSLADMPATIFTNLKKWLEACLSYFNRDVFLLAVLVLLVLFLGTVLVRRLHPGRKFLALFFTVVAFFAGAGISVVLLFAYFPPRCCVSLGIFLTLVLLYVLTSVKQDFLKKSVVCLACIAIIYSAGFLISLGNAYRDQYEYENNVLFNGLTADLITLHNNPDTRLNCFYITPNFTPCCTNLRFIIEKYNWTRGFVVSLSMFIAAKYVSWLPINYDLRAAVLETDREQIPSFPAVIERPNYVIRATNDPGRYLVELRPMPTNTGWLPIDVTIPGRYGKP